MTVVSTRIALTPDDRETCFTIRRLVFVAEQGVPFDAEFDEHDGTATHLLAVTDECPAGTLRWRRIAPRTARIERVAVLRAYRNLGIGRKLLRVCLARIASEGCDEAVLHAQIQVQDFYRRFRFAAVGDSFVEDGIQHIRMQLHPVLPLHRSN